jgi:hypothetical protein
MRRRLVPAVVLTTTVGALLVPLACSEDASTPSRDDGPTTSVAEPNVTAPAPDSMEAISVDEVDCDAFAALGPPTSAESLRGAAAAVSNPAAQATLNSLADEAERVQAAHPGDDIFTLTSRSVDDPPLPADIEVFQTRLFTELFPLGEQLQAICVPGS